MKKNILHINSVLTVSAVVLVALGFFINDPFRIFRFSYSSAKPLVQKIKKPNVSKIVVMENRNKLYEVYRDAGEWRVMGMNSPEDTSNSQKPSFNTSQLSDNASLPSAASQASISYRANKNDVDSALENLFQAKQEREVTNNHKKYIEYKVDDANSFQIMLYNKGNNKLFHVHVGKEGASFSSSLTRLDSDKTVYSVPVRLKTHWNKTVDQLRDKSLLNFIPENVDSIQWSSMVDKADFSLKREEGNEKFWKVSVGEKESQGDLNKVNILLKDIQKLSGNDFYTGDEEIFKIVASLNILLQSKLNIVLEIHSKKEDENQISYLAKSSYLPYFVSIPNHIIEKILENPEVYIKKEEEKKEEEKPKEKKQKTEKQDKKDKKDNKANINNQTEKKNKKQK